MKLSVLAKPAFRAQFSAVSSCVCLYRNVLKHGIQVIEWNPQRMLFGHYDVLHLHWPDNVLSEKSSVRAAIKMALLFTGMAFVRAQGRGIVWTSHNLKSHEQRHPRLERIYWKIFPRLLSAISCPMHWIASEVRADSRFQSVRYIEALPFGSWAGMYPEDVRFTDALRMRLGIEVGSKVALWFGLVRRYKGLETLIEIFSASALSGYILVIAGHCADQSYLTEVKAMISGKANIRADFGFVDDGRVASYFQLASICVFPFAAVTNSGSARLALTFNRHILVPDFPFATEFRSALGAKWVSCYPHVEGLSVSAVLAAFQAGEKVNGETLEWGDYDWETTASKTIELYRKIS